jgi:hypothetical protein
MSEELKKLQAAWSACDKKITNAFGELDGAAQTEKNLKDWLDGAREDIVERAAAARKAGATGNALADYLKVADVKKAWDAVQATMVKLKAGHERYAAGVSQFAALHAEALRIKGQAEDEVARRKKKVADSKSIPDLEKLAAAIGKVINTTSQKHMNSVAGFAKAKSKAFAYDQLYLQRLNGDIAAKTNTIKSVADDETVITKLAPRHLAAVGAKVNDMAKQAILLCGEAVKLHRAGDAKAAKASFDKAFVLAEQAEAIGADLGKSLKAGAETVKASKDGMEIMKKLDGISSAVRALLNQIAQTQKAMKS